MADKFDRFSDLLRAALGDRLAPADSILDMFADDVLFEFPYAPDGLPRRLDGKAALARHLERIGPLLSFGTMELNDVHHAGTTVVVEFSCTGRGVETGAPYNQVYVSVVTMRDGRIAHYRDYWNPLVVLTTLGGAEAAAAAFAGAAR